MAKIHPINLTQPVPVELPRARRRREAQHVLHRCTRCQGTGHAPCRICGGAGETMVGRDVFGRPQMSRCCGCFGTKMTRCQACAGVGWH